MSKRASTSTLFISLLLLTALFLSAQNPTGIITGNVTDESGAVIPNATVIIVNKATNAARTLAASADGLFSAPSLDPGEYEVRVEVKGFRTTIRPAQVEAGSTTTVNMAMTLGTTTEVVNVEGASAQINYESNAIEGSILRSTIQDLPLNGRSYLQLASLEPGVSLVAASPSQFNGVFTVSILGGISGRTLITLDGGSIDASVAGGSQMNFSQEVVQEFQVQSINYDLSTGITSVGAINVVTRSGSNDFHGSGYFFFRDHNMAAYPGLPHLAEFPNPFFARRNPGFWFSGPVIKNKLFFFFNYEYQNQVQAVLLDSNTPQFAPLNAAFSSPYRLKTLSLRMDYHLSDRNSLFVRYSHDGNNTFGPGGGPAEPSSWVNNLNWADQSIAGLTTSITPALVNDARFQYNYWSNHNTLATPSECVYPCVGENVPTVLAFIGSNFGAGQYGNAPQITSARRFEFIDNLAWQKGSHRLRFGTDIEHYSAPITWDFCPEFCTAALAGIFPATVSSTADILNMPVFNLPVGIFEGIGVGSPNFSGPYHHDQENQNLRPKIYFQDTWKLRPNLTVNYGIAWEHETGLFNSDLPTPQLLAPIYGANNLGPTPTYKKEWQPVFGFAWSPGKSGKTVIRGGAGLYWETNYYFEKWRGQALYAPLGNNRITLDINALTNVYPGIINLVTGAPLPIGAPLPDLAVTNMTIGQELGIYNQQIGGLEAKFAGTGQTGGPISVTGLDVAKTAVELFPPNYALGRSYQSSLGVQRDLGHDMVLTADWARRQGAHFNLEADLDVDHFNAYSNGVQQSIIPVCTLSQRYVPGQECVQGPINQWTPEGRSIYEGLLVKLQKRLSHRYLFIASYAYQNLNTDYIPYSSENYALSYGPGLSRHNLNIAGTVNLPWGFQLTVNSSILSRTPVEAVTTGVDITGTYEAPGGNGVLPGLGFNCLGITCGKGQLDKAVAAWNSSYAGKASPNGTPYPTYVLPGDYQFGDPTFSQDFRLTKIFTYKERYRLLIFGEVFNAFNIANLSGYNFTLDAIAPGCTLAANGYSVAQSSGCNQSYTFGQPTQRALQTFGSGGPRAFQVGGRFTF